MSAADHSADCAVHVLAECTCGLSEDWCSSCGLDLVNDECPACVVVFGPDYDREAVDDPASLQ